MKVIYVRIFLLLFSSPPVQGQSNLSECFNLAIKTLVRREHFLRLNFRFIAENQHALVFPAEERVICLFFLTESVLIKRSEKFSRYRKTLECSREKIIEDKYEWWKVSAIME
ncbi:hypothetical protein NPIL_248381 [Nephila pilipes]|uniref:Uncharacterized protein n=1 Tax=Nephila pilipes TaxID=299642 RepID=A0A8X6UAH6_NEPPI|nr:hypothetical protein NPIL_248381 [Nephila pilipes]